MRSTVLAGFVLAIAPGAALAQNASYLAVVADPEVLLRAGPSGQFPETGTVPRGAKLVVDHEEFGWLAVQAPAGSVSWVPNSFIDFDPARPIPQNVVTQAEVTLASGRVGLPQPLQDIRKAKLPEGTPLTVIGQKVTFDNKLWYPVAPPPGDFRYVPKTAVQVGEPVNTAFLVRDTAPPGLTPASGTAPPIARADAPAKPGANHPLWVQAEAAERDGRVEDAEKLFFQLARLMNEPGGDHDTANLCYTRIHTLREKKRTGSTLVPGATTGTTTGSTGSRPTLLPPQRDEKAAPVPPAAAPSEARSAWTGPGKLLRSALALDGRQTYVLESAPGVPRLYAVGAANVDLKPFVNRKVDLFGVTSTRKDLERPFVVVSHVEPTP